MHTHTNGIRVLEVEAAFEVTSFPILISEEAGVQREQATCLMSHRELKAQQKLDPGLLHPS